MKRFIPTYVGLTFCIRGLPFLYSVHPHVCGAYLQVRQVVAAILGSSPRMWGLHRTVYGNARGLRFIPTYVGLTEAYWKAQAKMTVHPHVCGAYDYSTLNFHPLRGSSPRMWGLHDLVQRRQIFLRFIPTYVGLTFILFAAGLVTGGSSPRMWGLHLIILFR